MSDTKKLIQDFIDTGSKFIKLEDGQFVRGKFLSISLIDSPFKDAEGNVTKQLETVIVVNGLEKTLSTGSKRYAEAFMKVDPEPGDLIQVKRLGTGKQTLYSIDILDKVATADAGATTTESVNPTDLPF